MWSPAPAASSSKAASNVPNTHSASPPNSSAMAAASAILKEIYIGLPEDPAGDDEPQMPIPSNLNYDMWLGSTPNVYYTEKRVHPQVNNLRARYDRPGWLRCEQFGAGMITGWGAHHIDIAHWAMDLEHSGPTEVVATAEFPAKGIPVGHPRPVPHTLSHAISEWRHRVHRSEKYPTGPEVGGRRGLALGDARQL